MEFPKTEYDDLFEQNRRYLIHVGKKRYAQAILKIVAGVVSAPDLSRVFGVMMGSMPNVRNDYVLFRSDHGNLRRDLRKMGLEFSDCLSGELSPESHEYTKRDGSLGVTAGLCWHGHGVMKVQQPIKRADLWSILCPMWGKIHGSEIVDVKIIDSVKRVTEYIVKDIIKNYLTPENRNHRLLMSDGYLPYGFRDVDKFLTHWAIWHGAGWSPESVLSNQREWLIGEYIPFCWNVKREYLLMWCKGESFELEYKGKLYWIEGGKPLAFKIRGLPL
jgi:hypothetical protein